jgi:hypothetical protein
MTLAEHVQTRFVLVDHLGLDQRLLDVRFDTGQVLGAALDQAAQHPPAHRDPQEVLQDLAGARQTHEVLLHQIDPDRSNRRPAPDWGKGSHTDLLARGAWLLLALIFPRDHTRGRQIHHLATLSYAGSYPIQPCLAMLAAFDPLHDHLIGRRREPQALPVVTRLPSRLLPAFLAQTLGLAYEPIRGRGQVAIVAVFGLPLSEQVHPLEQLGDQRISLGQLLLQHALLLFQLVDSFFWRHACTLRRFAALGKPLGDLGSNERVEKAGTHLQLYVSSPNSRRISFR